MDGTKQRSYFVNGMWIHTNNYVDLGEKALREHIIGRDEQVKTYHFHQN